MYLFSCWEYDPFYGILTLLFISLPTPFILSSIIGTIAGGYYGAVWGILIGLSGYFLRDEDDGTGGILTLFLLVFGFGFFFIGLIRNSTGYQKRDASTESRMEFFKRRVGHVKKVWHIFFIYPFLVLVAPFIFLSINLQALLRPDNAFIKEQAKLSCLGESVLEATPQFCLQLYVVLSTWNATWLQLSSITTSVITLSLANLDKFLLHNKNIELGLNIDTVKYFPIMFLNSAFRIVTIALLATIFHINSLLIFVNIWAVAGIIFYGTYKCSGKMKMEKESEVVECMALSFYTMTNLDNTKAARLFRKLSTYFYVIVYSLMMVSMVLGTLNKEEYPELMDLMDLIPYQNIFLSVTISIGLLSLILDWIYARVGWESVFHSNLSRTGVQSREDQGHMVNIIIESGQVQLRDQRSPNRPLFWLFWVLQKFVYRQRGS